MENANRLTASRSRIGRVPLAAMAMIALAAAMIAVDIPQRASAQSDDAAGRIVARLLDDGRVEFGWQPTGGERILPRLRYFPAEGATVDRWLNSSPVEVGGSEIGRINARLLGDGRIEFAFTPTDGERILTRARYFPPGAQMGRWLRSTEITIRAPAALRFTAVSAGPNYTCAIRASGAIACWGRNDDGQTDTPDGTFTAVSAGLRHACGLRENGEIECWGEVPPEEYVPTGTYSAVSAGWHAVYGLRESGELEPKGWGIPSGRFIDVSTNGNVGVYACAIRESGEIACWGEAHRHAYNAETQEVDLIYTGQTDPPPGRFTQVSAGVAHACAIRETGEVACWGWNDDGQADPPEGTFTAVSAGGGHTCAIRDTGEIACWGDWWGAPRSREGSFTAVSAGGNHTCAIRESGAIECWGSNSSGESTPPTN